MTTFKSARSKPVPLSKTPSGRADQTSTAPIDATKRKSAPDAVDQTSARSVNVSKRKPCSGRADQTSTGASRAGSRSKRIGDAPVDQTSARSTLGAKRNTSPGHADQASTTPICSSKRKEPNGVVDQTPAAPNNPTTSNVPFDAAGPTLADPILGILAYAVDDLEMVRIANENRLRALTTEQGLTLQHPDVARMAAIVDVLKVQEHQAILGMGRVVRRHPLWQFMKPIAGVGEKQFARLLAVIGDPYWNDLHNRPRTMRELRAYCGWHVIEQGHADNPTSDSKRRSVGVAPKRQRGAQSNWNDEARKRVWLIAESCMKQRNSVYRDVYDSARKQYADTVHPTACVRCGPKGKPAQVGSPRSAGHQHAMALRKVAVAFLADLWREAKRLHTEQSVANTGCDTQQDNRRQVKPSNTNKNGEVK